MPAPKHNLNGARSGLAIPAERFGLGKLPKHFAKIERGNYQFRRTLEQAVLSRGGRINEFEAATIQTAARWERHSQLCLRWLRESCDTMNHEERLSYSREIARASAERDKCLKALKLDRKKDVLDVLYSSFDEDQDLPDDAADAKPEADDAPCKYLHRTPEPADDDAAESKSENEKGT